jgi:hypothetical protein
LTPERINELIDDAVRLLGNVHYKKGAHEDDAVDAQLRVSDADS